MAAPTPFDRQTSFALYTAENPGEPHSGVDLDGEFNAVKISLDETQANLALIQDADGLLARGSVGRAQLGASLSISFDAPSVWETATSYLGDQSTVFRENIFYIAIEDHTSGTFATDLAAGKWEELADFSATAQIDDGSVTAAKLASGAVTTVKINAAAVTAAKMADNAVGTGTILDSAVTPAKMNAASDWLAFASEIIPAGVGPLPYAGTTAPTGWLLCYGQAVSRTTYAALFAVIGTVYGAGDGSTTFNLPDMRGRYALGKDDMGGSAANRVTNAVAGLNAASLGNSGGEQSFTLEQANIPNYTLPDTLSVSGTVDVQIAGQAPKVPVSGTPTGAAQSGGGSPAFFRSDSLSDLVAAFAGSVDGSVTSGGSDTAKGFIPPTLVVNYIIKAH